MVKKVFKVFFDVGVTKATKNEYLNAIKNEWKYPSVANFLNTIAGAMVDDAIIILKMDKPIIDRLTKKIKDKNYNNPEDWFKSKIREELNE